MAKLHADVDDSPVQLFLFLFSREDVNIPESHNRQSLRRRLLFLPLHSATSSSFVLGNEGRYRNLMRKVS